METNIPVINTGAWTIPYEDDYEEDEDYDENEDDEDDYTDGEAAFYVDYKGGVEHRYNQDSTYCREIALFADSSGETELREEYGHTYYNSVKCEAKNIGEHQRGVLDEFKKFFSYDLGYKEVTLYPLEPCNSILLHAVFGWLRDSSERDLYLARKFKTICADVSKELDDPGREVGAKLLKKHWCFSEFNGIYSFMYYSLRSSVLWRVFAEPNKMYFTNCDIDYNSTLSILFMQPEDIMYNYEKLSTAYKLSMDKIISGLFKDFAYYFNNKSCYDTLAHIPCINPLPRVLYLNRVCVSVPAIIMIGFYLKEIRENKQVTHLRKAGLFL